MSGGRRRAGTATVTAAATALLALASPALAAQTAGAPEVAQPNVEQAAPARRTHAGLFLRLAVGPAYLRESFSPDGGGDGASYAGSGPALAVAVGRFVRPGLVVGGACQLGGIINRSETFRGVTYTLDDTIHFVDAFGALVDYYPNPRRGFHAGGALELVAVTDLDTHMGGSRTSLGPGIALHAGKEWFVSGRWSIGVLGALTLYHVGNDHPVPPSTSIGVLPTLLAAFTFD